MDGDDIGATADIVNVGQLDAHLAGGFLGEERVVSDHVHLKRAHPLRHLASDPPEPEHAERLAIKLRPAQ